MLGRWAPAFVVIRDNLNPRYILAAASIAVIVRNPALGTSLLPAWFSRVSANVTIDRHNPGRLTFWLLSIVLACRFSLADAPPTSEQLEFFESKVRPLLIEQCYECHWSQEQSGDLRIDTAAAVAEGGSRGRLLVPGDPENSLLMRAVLYDDPELQMPPTGKLDEASIEVLRRWIEMGAPDPRESDVHSEPISESPLERDPASHWAFNAPKVVVPPLLIGSSARDPIDAFAEHRASEHGIGPNPIASREVLIRRLYFDLTGLPPTHDEVQSFVESDRTDAYVRLVDRLLASPEFGHRFGRHWLDVARYADTVGYALAGKERVFKGSERYRDWTIRAFADDMPYDEMLRHQLAGDRTDPANEQGNLDAMGFLTLGRRFLNPLDTIDDRIDVITRGLLGMTVTCARCHDHKFDPIPSSDYYSMGGIIFSSEQPEDGASPLMMVDKKNPIDSPVLIRGQIGNHGPIAPRQFLTALRKPDEPRFTDGSGRWELVHRITAPDNPLTARVMVNRLWRDLVGKSLVDTPSDFGFRTDPPAVAEVLDDLALEFSRHWSVKRIVRRIVLTRIYRQTAESSPDSIKNDPDNLFLARANRKRRDFESLRDSIFHVSGYLDQSLGGAPVEITLDTPNPRRTVYARIDRQNLPSLFRTFDFANPDAHSPGRYFTTVPQQALFLLNDHQMLELARRAAKLVRRNTPSDEPARLAPEVFRQVLGRDPSAREAAAAVAFLQLPLGASGEIIDPRSLWSYGTATIDDRDRVLEFVPFAVFKEGRWQVAEDFPTSAPFGHAYLGGENGHTPNESKMAVVRRFTAPFDGRVQIRGQMGHRSEDGDGVRASILVAGERRFSETQKKNNRPYGPVTGRVGKGEYVELVASPGGSSSFDTFYWRASIQLVGEDGQVIETESTKHFSGPFDPDSNQPLDRLAQLAQTLFMSNEFAFVD